VVFDDPPLAVGSAKELVESTAKVVLNERGLAVDNDDDDVPALVSKAQRALGLHPTSSTPGPDGTAVKKILGGLMAVITGSPHCVTVATAPVTERRVRGSGCDVGTLTWPSTPR
jgi:hypothetical protein